MFLEIAVDCILAGICCTLSLVIIIAVSEIWRKKHEPFAEISEMIAWVLFLAVNAGLSTLLRDLFAWIFDISPLITIPVYYFPNSVFPALRAAETDWLRYLAVIWASGVAAAGFGAWLYRRRKIAAGKRPMRMVGNMLAVLNWYSPIYWWFAMHVSRDESESVEEKSANKGAQARKRIGCWRMAVLGIAGIAVLLSISLLFDFRLSFRSETDVLSLLGVPEEDIIESDLLEPAAMDTPYFSADDRYSKVEGIDFLRWEYAQEVEAADVYIWMQPLEERLTQALGEPEELPPEKGIFGNPAEKVLEWTAIDDNGEMRTIKMLYVPHDAYYSEKIHGGMAVEVRLDN